MPWLAGAIVLTLFVGTLVAARARKASPYNVAGGLVLTTAALAWVALIIGGTHLPRDFRGPLLVGSNLAGVVACLFAFTRRLIWPIFPLLYYGWMLLFLWAWDGMPRMF